MFARRDVSSIAGKSYRLNAQAHAPAKHVKGLSNQAITTTHLGLLCGARLDRVKRKVCSDHGDLIGVKEVYHVSGNLDGYGVLLRIGEVLVRRKRHSDELNVSVLRLCAEVSKSDLHTLTARSKYDDLANTVLLGGLKRNLETFFKILPSLLEEVGGLRDEILGHVIYFTVNPNTFVNGWPDLRCLNTA